MKAEILALLRESDKFVSGQELCSRFGVSRKGIIWFPPLTCCQNMNWKAA